MEIIKDSNNVVLFAGDLQLTESGVTGLGYAVPFCTPTTHSIETVGSLPDDWKGGHYSYDGEWVKTSAGVAADNVKLLDITSAIQEQNKTACKAFILSKYSEETQRNAALGIYGETVKSEIADHIARIILEENRVFDTLEAPVWPEV